jgi:sulfonate dioxygenase
MPSTTETLAAAQGEITISLQSSGKEEQYRYAHLLPHFSQDKYPPLTPFDHVDPGSRALSHTNPRAFLNNAAKVIELTPRLGTEVHGINLAKLDVTSRDQLALEVCIPGLRQLMIC